jgi:hypothetical protein
MLQANPVLTPAQIYQALRDGALPMATPSPGIDAGYGFVQADAAFAAMPQAVPAAPTLNLASSSIADGASAASSAELTVTAVGVAPPTSGHGGGGALDVLTLLGVAALGLAHFFRFRPRVLI